MTFEELRRDLLQLRNTWAKQSNATEDQEELFAICEMEIHDLDNLITLAGGTPEPPPPRIRF